MTPMRIAASLLGLALLALAPAAQEEETPVPTPPKARPISTGAPRSEALKIQIPVVGITPENKGTVGRRLAGLRTREFVCAGCEHRSLKEGECPTCQQRLEGKERALLESQAVYTSARGQTAVVITPAPGTEARLSQIESMLKSLDVTVSRTAMVLVPSDTLVFSSAGAVQADVDALSKTFAAAEIEVVVEPDADANEIRVRLKSGNSGYGVLAKAAKEGAPGLGPPDLLYRGRPLKQEASPAAEGAGS